MSKERVSSEDLVPRYYGSETEYGYTSSNGAEPRPVTRITFPEGYPELFGYLANGGRLYADVQFPEYATAECSTLEELANHENAGDDIMVEVMRVTNPDLVLHKRCISSPGYHIPSIQRHTTGYHENYSTTIDIWNREQASYRNCQALASHLSTRYLYIGAGTPVEEGYAIGQKVQGLNTFSDSDTVIKKPLINTREEHHTGGADTPLHRLHITSGDANLDRKTLKRKFGTTSCVLRLLEHGMPLDDVFLANPLEAAHTAGGPVEHANDPLLLANGRKMTALDIQERLALKALDLSARVPFPEEEKEIIIEWLDVVDALKQYYQYNDAPAQMQQLDWYTKLQAEQRRREKQSRNEYENGSIADINDVLYDQLPDGIGKRLREKRMGRKALEAVETAKTNPPEQSRAKLRGGIILAAYQHQQMLGIHTLGKECGDFGPISTAEWGHFRHNAKKCALGPVNQYPTDEDVAEKNRQFGFC